MSSSSEDQTEDEERPFQADRVVAALRLESLPLRVILPGLLSILLVVLLVVQSPWQSIAKPSPEVPTGTRAPRVVGLSEDLVQGKLSNGIDVQDLKLGASVNSLKGCCPTLQDGVYLECCMSGSQCCPGPSGKFMSCCPQFETSKSKTVGEICIGASGHTVCAEHSVCCNGLCCGEGSVCCGTICCGKESTCCKSTSGAYICGARGNACGGPEGGTPLFWSNWPNAGTDPGWTEEDQKAVTKFRAEPDRGDELRCAGAYGKGVCLKEQKCCEGICCSGDAVCCGNLCCGPKATCCRNKFGVHTCGAEGDVCGGPIGGDPLAPHDWPNPSSPQNWQDPNQFGVTVSRYNGNDAGQTV